MCSNDDIRTAELAWDNIHNAIGLRGADDTPLLWHTTVELSVYPTQKFAACDGCVWGRDEPSLDQLLDVDMRPGFQLQRSPLRISRVLASECSLDVPRASIMSLDQVGVIGIDGSQQVSNVATDDRVELPAQGGSFPAQEERDLIEHSIWGKGWLHRADFEAHMADVTSIGIIMQVIGRQYDRDF
jgi:hypothetical protein